ncbi:Putative Translation initiation factor IF-2 [Aspergillus calidoustus]|uniref:Translation initiation factor IF-2, mitochondrial n=1 Tax=Aspergillus calidoustus TaxID=454130 RepID=A0A0U5GNS2_ASPCI|nr:Putative Translation initiation factor IF-2 [Aspergillus calidoustus]
MHRRTIVQLSRHHGIDWASKARLRDTLTHPPPRLFHSSPNSLDSSDPFSTKDADTNDNTSASSKPTPNFGGRWGSKAAQPATLSSSELAIRNALMGQTVRAHRIPRQERNPERSQGRQRFDNAQTPNSFPDPFGEHDRTEHQQPFIDKGERKRRHPPNRFSWVCPNCDFYCSGKHSACPQCGTDNPHAKPTPQQRIQDWNCPKCHYFCFGKHLSCPKCMTKRPPPEKVERAQRAPEEMRYRDWTCPRCFYPVFGKYKSCPKCGARRAAIEMSSPEPTYAEGSIGNKINIRKLASSEDVGLNEEGPRARALQKHIAKQQSDVERQEQKLNGTKVRTDPWSWDPSSLDQIKIDDGEIVDRGKTPRRRDGRRMQQSEDRGGETFDEEEYRRRREERKRLKQERKAQETEVEPALSPLYLPEFISVSNFADVVGMRPAQFVERLEEMGFEDVSYNHILDAETSGLIAAEFGFEPFFDTGAEDDLRAAPEPEDKSIWPSRPPVVTIMGHVDHGKTTILDWLRKSSVVASEHGGITQHIGAFSVSMPSGKTITFLDTPGHAAFLDMRRRGADVTDIVVLVVAADDSVKPQTIEAIKHATSAGVPIIVAISKIDKPGINPEKVKQDLAVHNIHVEDYGGDVQAIGVSGKTGEGMLELEEAIITLSEVLDHRADRNGAVEGWIVEGTTKSYGRAATMLVRRGTLRQGDVIVAGTTWARVRTLRNEAGVVIPEATPGMPVEVDGWREQPEAGMEFLQAEDEQHAKEVIEYRQERADVQKLGDDTTAINEARRELTEKRQKDASEAGDESGVGKTSSGPKAVHFVLKADVGGSAEAVLNSVTAVGNNEVYANVLRSEVGPISEFDIEHAAAAGGQVINFNMPIDPSMRRLAEAKGVTIMDHNIIYRLVDEVKDTLSEQLPPRVTQRVTGEAEIGQIFEISLKKRNKTSIAGCKVRNGVINRTKKVRVLRGQETIYDGSITSLRNVKKDVTEMRKDTECGIAFENWTDFAVGDQIQCYEEIFEKRSL